MAVSLRLPEDLLADVRQVAADEERPLNTQLIRFIRAGLELHRTGQSSPAPDPTGLAGDVPAGRPGPRARRNPRRGEGGRSE